MVTNDTLISVITPVYNGGYAFLSSLLALEKSKFENWELIVVDDGSTDASVAIASKFGAKVLHTGGRKGPSAARNLGARAAVGKYLCFIDADCEICGDVITELAMTLKARPNVDALFGSYDDAPKASNFLAQYRNLLHHYVHQRGCEDASTFWAGFGVVRRSLFWQVGGFDTELYPRPSIEDIELGYRLKEAGASIYLAKHLQVKHHKAWKLGNLIKTDVFDRGIPWTRLLLSNKSNFVNDLNLQTSSRISVVAAYSLLVCLLAACYKVEALIPGAILSMLLLYLNWDVYRFFLCRRGWLFGVKVVPLHWLYYLYGGMAFAVGTLLHWRDRLSNKTINSSIRTIEN